MKSEICCPNCFHEFAIEIHVMKTKKRGPAARDLGKAVNDLIVYCLEDQRMSYGATAKLLNSQDIPTPKNGTKWFSASVRRVYLSIKDRTET